MLTRTRPPRVGVRYPCGLPAPVLYTTHWTRCGKVRRLFRIPSSDSMVNWTCELRTLDLRGDRQVVGDFAQAMLVHPGVHISSFRATMFCRVTHQTRIFQEIPIFNRVLANYAHSVVLDMTSYSVTQRWSQSNGRYNEWGVRWQTCDIESTYWVRCSLCFFILPLTILFVDCS